MALRLVALRPECTVLLTGNIAKAAHFPDDGILRQEISGDHPETAAGFLAHWQPDVLIWAWGGLLPNTVMAAKAHKVHMILADAAHDGFDRRRDRWLPEVPRRLVAQFDVVMVRSQSAFARLVQLGRPIGDIERTQPLRPFGNTLPAHESDVKDITETLRGRPVWLAAHVHRDEIKSVLAAHRQALKTAHRLLLIVLVAEPDTATKVAEASTSRGLNTALWSDGHLPDDHVQVLVADAADEFGLWLRVAPVTFMGGSLSASAVDTDPYTAAAHGTAIIYGIHAPIHRDAYQRLLDAGAARIIKDSSGLGRAVIQMIAPDRAAKMAMAGWDSLTEGASSLDRLVAQIQSHLDGET